MEKKIAHLSEDGIHRPGTGQGMARRYLVPKCNAHMTFVV